jgi:hypothetical protein
MSSGAVCAAGALTPPALPVIGEIGLSGLSEMIGGAVAQRKLPDGVVD